MLQFLMGQRYIAGGAGPFTRQLWPGSPVFTALVLHLPLLGLLTLGRGDVNPALEERAG